MPKRKAIYLLKSNNFTTTIYNHVNWVPVQYRFNIFSGLSLFFQKKDYIGALYSIFYLTGKANLIKHF